MPPRWLRAPKPVQRVVGTLGQQELVADRRDRLGLLPRPFQPPQFALQRPPLLSHIGEKLRTSHLEGILSGEAKSLRTWQKGRMPSFPHAKYLALGLAKQHGYGADAPQTEVAENPDAAHAPDLINEKLKSSKSEKIAKKQFWIW